MHHPHGDASIGDAMVQIGQNWLTKETGVTSLLEIAAARYIEARLSKFALEVIYSPKITDGDVLWRYERNQIIFLLNSHCFSTRAEGIAVGLSTKLII
jgi:topoisomerase-4 subunit A